MTTSLTSPLSAIIKRAAESQVQGKASAAKEKFRKRMEGATDEVVIVVDCSGSMGDYVGSTGQSKYEHACLAIEDVRRVYPNVKVIALGSWVRECEGALPQPSGGTPLAEALTLAGRWSPRKTIVISDGMPDHGPTAVKAALALTGVVDTIYCGPEGSPAIDWLRSLAHGTGGDAEVWSGLRELGPAVRGLLGA